MGDIQQVPPDQAGQNGQPGQSAPSGSTSQPGQSGNQEILDAINQLGDTITQAFKGLNTTSSTRSGEAPNPPTSSSGQTTGQAIAEMIQALPERFAQVLDERNPKPTPRKVVAKEDSGTQEKTPGKKSFAEWWGG